MNVDAIATTDTWRWRWLLAAPHRLAFFAAAVVMGASALWWAAALVARTQGAPWPWALPPGTVHALVMGYGFLPLFFAGFLFTAGPKWLGLPPVQARSLVWPVARCVAGWLVFVAGAHVSPLLAAAGLVLVVVGFGGLTRRFAALLGASPVADRTHPTLILVGCSVGVALLAVAAAGIAFGADTVTRAAMHAGLWGCIAIVYVVVVHRMVPFFTASALPLLDAWRPMWLLWTLVGAVGFEALLAAAEVLWWPLPAWVRVLQLAVEVPAALLLLWLAVRWGLVQSLKIRLLAMLHMGFVWLGLAFALHAVSHVLALASDRTLSLGLAPLHALTMGFFGSTLLAMATRVSAGHSGRPLAADDTAWRLFWLLQAAVTARVVGDIWTAGAVPLLTVAALAWTGAVGAWALRYGRWYGTPRADGRPG